MLPLCAEHGIAYVPYGPLSGGWLAGKYARGAGFPEGSRMTQRPEPYEHLVADRIFDGLDRARAEAAQRRVSMAALAFAWVLSHPRRHRRRLRAVAAGAPRAGARGARRAALARTSATA